MNRRFLAGAALVVALAVPRYVRAHEGHAHRVLGTVAALHENHLQVRSTDGTAADVTLNDKTKIVRGKSPVKAADIKPGERIVVTAVEAKGQDGKPTMIATEIKLAAAS
jgi:hypothetical protein